MFSQQLQILFFELVGHVEIGTVGNVLVREEFVRITRVEQVLVGFGFQLVNELRHHLVVQWTRLIDIVPLIEAPDEFVAANGNRVWSRVGDSNSADVVVIEFD